MPACAPEGLRAAPGPAAAQPARPGRGGTFGAALAHPAAGRPSHIALTGCPAWHEPGPARVLRAVPVAMRLTAITSHTTINGHAVAVLARPGRAMTPRDSRCFLRRA
jgi:hypothetical protein